MDQPLWQPSAVQVETAQVSAFMAEVTRRWKVRLEGFDGLWAWSVSEPARFWLTVWDFCKIRAAERGQRVLVDGDDIINARFFPEARLNYAENLLVRRDDTPALVFWGEGTVRRSVSWRALYDLVSRLAQALQAAGVGPGDRVAAFVPNLPETVAAMLATASLGAVWSSCSPDFGVQGVLDRFGQIEPKVLITADGYYYNNKTIDSLDRVREVAAALPSLAQVIVLPYTRKTPPLDGLPHAVTLADAIAPYGADEIAFEPVPFDHPLFIMFSSGTTGKPKCIVHGVGGTLLQLRKEHVLHCDIRAGDRVFYFTTCGWMMWNWLTAALASGATLLLYDGSPFAPKKTILFDFADAEGMTLFGTSAKYIDACRKFNLAPADTNRLDALRLITSTGSPLVPEAFDFVYTKIKPDVQLASISGGTDIISCFVLGNPIGPVRRGEIQTRGLGMAVDVFDEDGRTVRGEKGELVCTRPFPSRPIGFWNDPDGSRYRAAYFARFPDVWCHGDYVELTETGGVIIYGRSDAVLNPGGVRIGTAEIYRQVEQLPEVAESIVIGQDWDADTRVVLFVKLAEGLTLTADLVDRIKEQIKTTCTPRHVPARVLQVDDIPRTKSGKIVELAVRDIVHGREIKNREALANPEALEGFRDRPELRS